MLMVLFRSCLKTCDVLRGRGAATICGGFVLVNVTNRLKGTEKRYCFGPQGPPTSTYHDLYSFKVTGSGRISGVAPMHAFP